MHFRVEVQNETIFWKAFFPIQTPRQNLKTVFRKIHSTPTFMACSWFNPIPKIVSRGKYRDLEISWTCQLTTTQTYSKCQNRWFPFSAYELFIYVSKKLHNLLHLYTNYVLLKNKHNTLYFIRTTLLLTYIWKVLVAKFASNIGISALCQAMQQSHGQVLCC